MPQETSTCILCGSGNNKFFHKENGYELFKCEKCELVFLMDKPSEETLKKTYNCESGKTFNRLSEQTEKFEKRLEAKKRYGVISKYLDKGNGILELGCGGGYFLELLKNHCYRVVGIEVSDELVNFARNTLKIDVRRCEVPDLIKQDEHFDAIILFEVISHLRMPLIMLKDLNKLINVGGTLVIETGNGGEVAPDIQDKWGLPEHIYFFSKKSLNILLGKCGFKIVRVFRFDVWWQRALLKAIARIRNKDASYNVNKTAGGVTRISPSRQFLKNIISSILLLCRYEIGRISATQSGFCSMIVIAQKSTDI